MIKIIIIGTGRISRFYDSYSEVGLRHALYQVLDYSYREYFRPYIPKSSEHVVNIGMGIDEKG
jgi:hypothetical protein